MKNFFARFKAHVLRENIAQIFSRFPMAIILIVVITILFFLQLHANFNTIIESRTLRVIFSGIVTLFLSVSISLHSEGYNTTKFRSRLLQILPITLGGFFYLGFTASIQNEKNLILFLLTLTGTLSYLFIAPFIRNLFSRDLQQSTYYVYLYNTSSVFLISVIFGGVLSLLGNIAIWSVFSLFDLKDILSYKIYSDWIIIACSFLAPVFALTQLPAHDSFLEDHFNENVFFSFLVKYIAIPFISLYFIILYTYSAKVLVNFSEWPKGEVSWLVIGFSIFGYIIYIFSYIFEEKNTFIRLFRKFFPGVVVPQLFMLFYAIYLRINQYDITMNRYFVVAFGIWLTTISLYLLFSRRRYLMMLPALLTIFILIISVGPWSVYEFPIARQQSQLEKNLIKAHILQNGKIVPLKMYIDIDSNLSREIYQNIDYLCNFDDCGVVKTIFPEQYMKIESDYRLEFEQQKKDALMKALTNKDKEIISKLTYETPSKGIIVSRLTDMIRVQLYYEDTLKSPYIYMKLGDNERIFPLDIDGYSKIIKLNSTIDASDPLWVYYDVATSSLQFYAGNNLTDTVNIEPKLQAIQKSYEQQEYLTHYPYFSLKDAIYVTGKYKIIIEKLQMKNPEYSGNKNNIYNYNELEGYVLVK